MPTHFPFSPCLAGPPRDVGEAALEPLPISEGVTSGGAASCGCTVRCAKRIIGRRWSSPEVQALLPTLPFEAAPFSPDDDSGDVDSGGGGENDGEVCARGGGGVGCGGGEAEAGIVVRTGGGPEGKRVASPVAVAAAVLRELKAQAEAYLSSKRHREFKDMRKSLGSEVMLAFMRN